MPFERISIEQAQALIEQGETTLIDIRDGASYAADHIEQAVHVTNDNVQEVLSTADKAKPVIVYCYHGNSSQGAADYFSSMGFSQAYSVDGGFEEWKLKR